MKFDFRTCAKTPSDLADDGGGEVVAGQLVPRRQGRHAACVHALLGIGLPPLLR